MFFFLHDIDDVVRRFSAELAAEISGWSNITMMMLASVVVVEVVARHVLRVLRDAFVHLSLYVVRAGRSIRVRIGQASDLM